MLSASFRSRCPARYGRAASAHRPIRVSHAWRFRRLRQTRRIDRLAHPFVPTQSSTRSDIDRGCGLGASASPCSVQRSGSAAAGSPPTTIRALVTPSPPERHATLRGDPALDCRPKMPGSPSLMRRATRRLLSSLGDTVDGMVPDDTVVDISTPGTCAPQLRTDAGPAAGPSGAVA